MFTQWFVRSDARARQLSVPLAYERRQYLAMAPNERPQAFP
jgi:hypothetical protein